MRAVTAMMAAIGVLGVFAAIGPARADGDRDGWRRHEWREHEWREQRWREHERREHAWRHEDGQRYYVPAPAYYPPPPVYDAPAPRPGYGNPDVYVR